MENKDQKGLDLKGLIKKLRDVTLAVQIIPFIYTALYLICMLVYLFAGETTILIMDTLFYVSPTIVVMFLVLSKMLRLCKWHRRAVLLPLIPQIPIIADNFLVDLSSYAIIVNIAVIAAMSALLLFAAYKVFFANGR